MKKIFTLCLLFCATTLVMAQTADVFQFVNTDGDVVPDGTTIVVNTSITDEFGDVLLPSGLSVKNTADEEVSLRIHCQLQTLDNGSFQICFPITCITKTAVETFDTASGPMNANEVKDLLTEWLPTAYGKCTAIYQVEAMKLISLPSKYESLGMGSTVTVEYVYGDPAGIESVASGKTNEPSACYNLNGVRLSAPQRGLNIVRMKNGQVVKQLQR